MVHHGLMRVLSYISQQFLSVVVPVSRQMTHTHDIDEHAWPFEKSINATVYSTTNVFHNDYPILTVAHDHEGDWQFLCGAFDGPDDMSIVCFGCMFDKHPFITEFSDLPVGWMAWREDENAPWQIEEMEPRDD